MSENMNKVLEQLQKNPELQEKVRLKTGLKSTLTGSVDKGRIVLEYSSREELEHFNELMEALAE